MKYPLFCLAILLGLTGLISPGAVSAQPAPEQLQLPSQSASDFWGERFQSFSSPQLPQRNPPALSTNPADWLKRWNQIAVDCSGLDHTPNQPAFGSQLGPHRASRAMAIVHIALYQAVNAFDQRYQNYFEIPKAKKGASMQAAIAQAAHDTLVALFPRQQAACDLELQTELNLLPNDKTRSNGITVGAAAAATILALRGNDGSQYTEPAVGTIATSNAAGKWRQDPVSLHPLALGAFWGQVKPFVLKSVIPYRAPAPPALNSAEYTEAFNEAKALGGDGVNTPTSRTAEQTEMAIFWAYDGTPSLCAPPRLYNQLTMHIADQMGTSSNVFELARLLVLTNVAMADACIAVWDSKFFYQYWRPVGGIRESDPGVGPSFTGDGNSTTAGDPNFMPLGAPASNLTGPNFTPPFPSYPSGHGGFGGALFETLRNFYGRDNVSFTFTSDEFNGVTLDNTGSVRPLLPRSFSSFSQAEEENGQSRIYLGIHWRFDKTAAIAQGRSVADYVFATAFTPAHKGKGKGR